MPFRSPPRPPSLRQDSGGLVDQSLSGESENLNGPGNKISLCGKWVSETGAGFAVARFLRLLVRLEKSGDF